VFSFSHATPRQTVNSALWLLKTALMKGSVCERTDTTFGVLETVLETMYGPEQCVQSTARRRVLLSSVLSVQLRQIRQSSRQCHFTLSESVQPFFRQRKPIAFSVRLDKRNKKPRSRVERNQHPSWPASAHEWSIQTTASLQLFRPVMKPMPVKQLFPSLVRSRTSRYGSERFR